LSEETAESILGTEGDDELEVNGAGKETVDDSCGITPKKQQSSNSD
jgi:hypothetical protein